MISLDDEISGSIESEVNKVCCRVFEKYSIDQLMEMVRGRENVYLLLHRDDREFVDIYVSNNGVDSSEFIAVPVPKRFAVLEPDKNYFEITLKANIALALRGERDFHL
ncbi:hypothetical protein [Geoglobus acetivorans]|uniref:Uncharacterized protein n=1 Tax=Geoglobus acetivorans TaxID=565033 RepID=A0ABZ3H0Q1_GEOAI|nr:hypothetical protein [Geoglobus acetivorans]